MSGQHPALLLIVMAILCSIAVADVNKPGKAYTDTVGSYKVGVVRYDWVDVQRSRNVPVKIYYPIDYNTPCPLIIFSHGLGGSREGYEYLGQYWASWGYISVHVQHKGSDSDIWKKAGVDLMAVMRRTAANPRNAIERPKDISFAIDQMEKLNKEGGLFNGHLDMNHIGVAGHSFGAFTTLAVAGQVAGGWLFEKSFVDPRVKAVIPMSAPVNKRRSLEKAFGMITIPCMHMTGTLDESPIGNTSSRDRRLPFVYIKAKEQYLITFNGGDHMIFSGRLKRDNIESKKDEHFQSLIKASTTAFWDAYLKGDQDAKIWLRNGGLVKFMGGDAVVEMK